MYEYKCDILYIYNRRRLFSVKKHKSVIGNVIRVLLLYSLSIANTKLIIDGKNVHEEHRSLLRYMKGILKLYYTDSHHLQGQLVITFGGAEVRPLDLLPKSCLQPPQYRETSYH